MQLHTILCLKFGRVFTQEFGFNRLERSALEGSWRGEAVVMVVPGARTLVAEFVQMAASEMKLRRGEAVVIVVSSARTLDTEFVQMAASEMQLRVSKQETYAIGSTCVSQSEPEGPDNGRRRQGIQFPMKLCPKRMFRCTFQAA